MFGLYVHIPFCNKICPYCDFYKLVASDHLKEKFIDALSQEMKIKKLDDYLFDSLYIGGGSPSCLKLELLEKLFLNFPLSDPRKKTQRKASYLLVIFPLRLWYFHHC